MRSRRSFARTPYRSRLLVLIGLLLVAVFAPTSPNDSNLVVVFGAEACRLVAYDKQDSYANQTVIPASPDGGLDINAQICFFPGGQGWFIAGEDTGQPTIPAGWGIFQLQGQPGSFYANQIGKLTPTFQEHLISQPENYGCGILSDGRVVTTDVGDQYPPTPGNGQLIIWFPPFDRWSEAPYTGSTGQVKYCKLDIAIETAGGIYVDENDNIYVASNRPSVDGGGNIDFTANGPGGVFAYHPPFPTSNTALGGCGLVDGTGAPLATTVDKELVIPANYAAGVLTASAIAKVPGLNHLYVSSVFSGRVAEFDLDDPLLSLPPPIGGVALRYIVQPPVFPPESLPYPTNGTPFGLGVDPDDGQVYYADLGIGAGPPPGPEGGEGDVYRVPFDGSGDPLPPIKINDEGFDYPEGIGVLERAMLVHPSPTIVRTSRTKQFTVVGIGLPGAVIWSVEGGPANGTITEGGLYTAPATVPAGGRAYVLATTLADPSVVGRAPVEIRLNAGNR